MRHHLIICGSVANEHPPRAFHALKSIISTSSPILTGGSMWLKKTLLRVLIEVYSNSLDDAFQTVNLRFLAYEARCAPIGWIGTYELPSSISLLWNVQTLIISKNIVNKITAPSEIWKMPQLRHMEFNLISLPDRPRSDGQHDSVLLNLQTLQRVLNFKCSEAVCKRIPNIKKLGIFYGDFSDEGEKMLCYGLNFSQLRKLESLNCFFHDVPNRNNLLQNLTFPSSLKKLRLRNCMLLWEDLTIIGSLPHLEVLKLNMHSVTGPEWNPIEGRFLCLKFLGIYSCFDLVYWNANNSHFPVLEQLVLERLWELEEIPLGIREIPMLKRICVENSNTSVAISAIKILEELENLGNEGLQVQVGIWDDSEREEFREKVKLEGLTSHSFHLSRSTRRRW